LGRVKLDKSSHLGREWVAPDQSKRAEYAPALKESESIKLEDFMNRVGHNKSAQSTFSAVGLNCYVSIDN